MKGGRSMCVFWGDRREGLQIPAEIKCAAFRLINLIG